MDHTFKDNKIAELRKEAGLSQRALARHLATSQANISRWETGISEPSILECWRMADFFNVSIDYLCGRTEF
ncbi:MAG: helix-turn-helix domain-containing protein [Clostridia bacterium]|nr:helix-turn-helix domain-containing protein [Clostridia bacterium]